ncbi:MAG: hypothetical protein M1821_004907 [Bathelium mastoideum]|nr:MAG: hypothetical protein M1821_004907 [Bathelium mastoideum]KAI9689047.1 MAG: hypothetical protein M1822_000784 [Bathelium mastoideum]
MGTDAGIIHNGRAIGWITLGVSLYDTLNRLKAESEEFPAIELSYSSSNPLLSSVVVELPSNGVRLRFDGPDQRLRVIEILDFYKIDLTYKGNAVIKRHDSWARHESSGPPFRHVSQLFGPTPDGEYYTPGETEQAENGLWVVSWPGVAFSFPFHHAAYKASVNFNVLLASSAAFPATSMAIFEAQSWAKAQNSLFTATPSLPRSLNIALYGRCRFPDEIEMTKIHKDSSLELVRRYGQPFWIKLGETTMQDLITELGPPDAIYYKNDRRLSIHNHRKSSSHRPSESAPIQDEFTDNDETLGHAVTDDSDFDSQDGVPSRNTRQVSFESFFNYCGHGFDILVAPPQNPHSPGHLTATKILFHGNVPGSYNFNRYRRSRWILDDISLESEGEPLTSEMKWGDLSLSLKHYFRSSYTSEEERGNLQRGMVLNRGMDESPGSSCEFLGDFEDDFDDLHMEYATPKVDRAAMRQTREFEGLSDPELFGFPGMAFEVLRNGAISCLTVF